MLKNKPEKKLEIEKRILLKKMPELKKFDKTQHIKQYYTPSGRYRVIHDLTNVGIKNHSSLIKYIKTIKSTISAGVNHEEENEVTKKEFDKEIKKATRVLTKIRYIKKVGKYKWEIDVFSGLNLIIAEIEVNSKKELHTVKIPAFIAKQLIMDITGIKQFSNFNLADPIKK